MNCVTTFSQTKTTALWIAADKAVRSIPPAWSLRATVAVNPFLGQSDITLLDTAALIGRLTGADIFPERSVYKVKLASNALALNDVEVALARYPIDGISVPDKLLEYCDRPKRPPARIPDITTLAAEASGLDWPRIVAERIGLFLSGYFDQGQALWAMNKDVGLFAAWRHFAMHDLTPGIVGLKGFANLVSHLPPTPQALIAFAGKRLGLQDDPGTYFHQLLIELSGYAQYARHLQFVAERDGGKDETAIELLAVRLVFEIALLRLYAGEISAQWQQSLVQHLKPLEPTFDMAIDAVLLDAAETAHARQIASCISADGSVENVEMADQKRPSIQAAFCIDVRSEVFRRALETIDPAIVTIGFAGFFGIGTSHRQAASDLPEHRLPVLLPPGQFSCEVITDREDQSLRYRKRAHRALDRFRQAAVSSFAFMESRGLGYAGALLKRSLGWDRSKTRPFAPKLVYDLPLAKRVDTAEAVLKAMSLTENFAPVVLLAGHRASSVNNAFLSALQCGACGGHAGDVNARLLADLLNEEVVKTDLGQRGIAIPADTIFVAGVHDTTTDEVVVFDEDLPTSATWKIKHLSECLKTAGKLARLERVKRLPRSVDASPLEISRDWAEIRPEWGLAGCAAFIAAPRALTAKANLEGRAFLHDYVWQKDEGFKVLELILTAPVVVASWINLQYYGSTVAPALFGSGNKLLHNVVGGIGVVEGNGGLMRAGLPWQSVHDGVCAIHDTTRLAVFVDAPVYAINEILERHPNVRTLFDKGWLQLYQVDDGGGISRYTQSCNWDVWKGGGDRVGTRQPASSYA